MSWDHAQLVHEQWLLAAMSSMQLFIVRVGTHDNIADLPSREARRLSARCQAWCVLRGVCCQEYRILKAAGAVEVPPVLHDAHTDASAWEVLQERWSLHS